MASACPFLLDRNGTDVHAENARLRAQGPVVSVELPGGSGPGPSSTTRWPGS